MYRALKLRVVPVYLCNCWKRHQDAYLKNCVTVVIFIVHTAGVWQHKFFGFGAFEILKFFWIFTARCSAARWHNFACSFSRLKASSTCLCTLTPITPFTPCRNNYKIKTSMTRQSPSSIIHVKYVNFTV